MHLLVSISGCLAAYSSLSMQSLSFVPAGIIHGLLLPASAADLMGALVPCKPLRQHCLALSCGVCSLRHGCVRERSRGKPGSLFPPCRIDQRHTRSACCNHRQGLVAGRQAVGIPAWPVHDLHQELACNAAHAASRNAYCSLPPHRHEQFKLMIVRRACVGSSKFCRMLHGQHCHTCSSCSSCTGHAGVCQLLDYLPSFLVEGCSKRYV